MNEKSKNVMVMANRTHKILISDIRNPLTPTKSFSIVAPNMSSDDVATAIIRLIKTYGLNIKVGD